MRVSRILPITLSFAVLSACADPIAEPGELLDLPVFTHTGGGPPNASGGNFGAPLNAAEEVMPPGVENTSTAAGNTIFRLNRAGTELSYQLIVANIENVVAAHIHLAPAGANGGVVVWLYPSTAVGGVPPGGGPINGVIAEGTITESDFVGALATQPMSALIAHIKAANAYVNVHTNDGVPPTNTGPGDYPGGEIRGQVAHRGH
jgi:hypothetical protein